MSSTFTIAAPRFSSNVIIVVFIGNPFEMRLLNLRINFLLRTFCPHLGRFFWPKRSEKKQKKK